MGCCMSRPREAFLHRGGRLEECARDSVLLSHARTVLCPRIPSFSGHSVLCGGGRLWFVLVVPIRLVSSLPLCDGRYLSVPNRHWYLTGISTQQASVPNGHQYPTGISTQQASVPNWHPYPTGTGTQQASVPKWHQHSTGIDTN